MFIFEVALLATLVVVAVQISNVLSAVKAVRAEISSARWEWGRASRPQLNQLGEGSKPLDR
jgi:hypothetical protein